METKNNYESPYAAEEADQEKRKKEFLGIIMK